ncbi:hypothetical protein [Piscinibacter sp.]|uniref:hypothetical protein n=1 Tax=Piscinibacter sp. TaxID=1903157 RepID=UPI0039E4DB86
MKTSHCFHALAAAALLAGSLAAAAAVPGGFGGDWRITHARPLPRASGAPGVPAAAAPADRVGQIVGLREDRLLGPAPLACAPATMKTLAVPAAGLFQGGLPAGSDPRELGLARGPVPSLRVDCPNASFDFHRADAQTLLVALDGRVWTLSRAPGALAADGTPQATVQRLLEAHFAGNVAYTEAGLQRGAGWLTPALLAGLQAELTRAAQADEPPEINGDPFTDTQEAPARFAVGAARLRGERARVPVRFADGGRSHTLHYELLRTPEGWRVDDITDRRGIRLRALLPKPAR